jgi:lysophospholipase L1-like esterase
MMNKLKSPSSPRNQHHSPVLSIRKNASRFLLCFIMSLAPCFAATPSSVALFDQKARAGEPVSVVFFGGSLTWGANASDPQTTSYRGRMMQYLQDKYPKTQIRFHDAAIGGTGSNLGIFRMKRDVFPYKPDLVFLDFTVNDGAEGSDVPTMAAYERIVRELLSSGTAVMPAIMCFKYHFPQTETPMPPRMQAHLKLLEEYHLTVADIYSHVKQGVKEGKLKLLDLWNVPGKDALHTDGAHPGDEGYKVFFDVVKEAYEKAITVNRPAVIPEKTVFEDKYPKFQRKVLVDSALPKGWIRQMNYRTSLWFDGLSSRWMGDVATASAKDSPKPLDIKFTGSTVGIFGERNGLTPPIKITIDGKPIAPPQAKEGEFLWPLDSSRMSPPKKGSGNLFYWLKIADLPDGEHKLRIEPVFDGCSPDAEFRIESVCSAGK